MQKYSQKQRQIGDKYLARAYTLVTLLQRLIDLEIARVVVVGEEFGVVNMLEYVTVDSTPEKLCINRPVIMCKEINPFWKKNPKKEKSTKK